MEELYHYIWKTSLRGRYLRDVDGKKIEVLDPGVHNHDSGPDFFNAKLIIEGVEWAGNVEIHVKASDWQRHSHSGDPAYNNVILHLVGLSDQRISRSDGSLIPQVEIRLPEDFFSTYLNLHNKGVEIRCANRLSELSALCKTDWIETLSIERLQQKAQRVLEMRNNTGGDWEQTCFILLARGLGFGLNGDPFELVARSVPLRILHHHSDNLMQLEAILFGQAAMLDPTSYLFDEYYQTLCREYYFLARKYGLKPLRPGLWKYSKTRPQNFPHRRVAFLASATQGGFSLFTRLVEAGKKKENLTEIFNLKAEGYWKNHFSFDTDVREVPAELSLSSRILLTINVAIPLLYAFAKVTGDYEFGERIYNMTTELPSENNAIIRQWKGLGLDSKDAAESQALLHLKKEYCDKGKCIYCRFGHQLLRKAVCDNH